MKKIFVVAIVASMALAACGKKKAPETATAGSAAAGSAEGSAAGSDAAPAGSDAPAAGSAM
ncbi:MAG: hypothetical protein NT062_11105 [Proteobacteria bacterium]|nr:hypothetical protein [Pseudomonadota bacterium]